MNKFAPVCPVRMYQELKENHPEQFGKYFLLLAHDVVANPKEYADVFADLEDGTIIMDNSVIELGTSVDVSVLKDACEIVKADVLAIPDVLEDGMGTYEASWDFVNKWANVHDLSKDPELMFIPQGDDLDDYVECVMQAADNDIPMDWIGIARNTTKRIIDSRTLLVGFFAVFSPSSKLHLLGFSEDTTDDIKCASMPFVEGIDSAVPVRTAKRIQTVGDITDPGPRGNWWDDGILTDDQIGNIHIVNHLIGVK